MIRHRFEPARLLLGVILLGAALAYVMDALGEWQVPGWLLLILVPVALVAAAATAMTTYIVRRRLSRGPSGAGEAGVGAAAEDAGNGSAPPPVDAPQHPREPEA